MNLFLNNKYTRIYFQLMNTNQNGSVNEYYENHHVIPLSLGGDDNTKNIVRLTARQHFIAHLLLTKMTVGLHKMKMSYAFSFMLTKNSKLRKRHLCASRWYEYSRQILSETQKGRKFSEDTKSKMKLAAHKKYLNADMRRLVSTWTKNPSQATRNKIANAARNRSEESLEKMRLAKSKPCSIDDGITIFSSKKKLAEVYGWGKNGTGSKNFKYIDKSEHSSLLFAEGVI